ncbi:MAG: hypothetical protein Q7J69_05590 [Candidatus Omnitrophota bacterium]|nr:hypothetical protein [Candidatus Omnitrophota bacterium]
MLTIFAIPKSFADPQSALIQRNAIQSWTLLRPRPEIFLFGDEAGIQEICRQFSLRHIPAVSRNEYGTPHLNDVVVQAERLATHRLMCYVNADIIFMSDFIAAIRRFEEWNPESLAAGSRWNLDIPSEWKFDETGWEEKLRVLARSKGVLQESTTDCFVFPRGFYQGMPPFAIGRTAFDNWLIWKARKKGSPVVNLTPAVMVIHQNHWTLEKLQRMYHSPEAAVNQRLAGPWASSFTLGDASHRMTPDGIHSIGAQALWNRSRCVWEMIEAQARRTIRKRFLSS